MKNNIFKLIGFYAVLGLLFVGCDQDNEGTKYETAGKTQYSFGAKNRVIEMIKEDNNQFKVELTRVDTNGDANLNVAFSLGAGVEAGLFVPESTTVSFKDGESVAYLTIKYEDLNLISPVGEFEINLSLSNDISISPAGTSTMKVTASRKLTYKPIGESIFTSEAFGEDDGTRLSWPVDTYKAEEADIYLLEKPYGKGYDIKIVVLDGKATVPGQKAWFYNDSYGAVYVRTTEPFDVEDGVIDMELEHYLPSISYSFGKFHETVELPK